MAKVRYTQRRLVRTPRTVSTIFFRKDKSILRIETRGTERPGIQLLKRKIEKMFRRQIDLSFILRVEVRFFQSSGIFKQSEFNFKMNLGETDKLVELLMEGYDHILDTEDEGKNILRVAEEEDNQSTINFLKSIKNYTVRRVLLFALSNTHPIITIFELKKQIFFGKLQDPQEP